VIGVVLFWYLFKKAIGDRPKAAGIKDQLLVRAPIFGQSHPQMTLSRFARTYATLIRSGVPILRTLEIVSAASNKVQIEDACVEIAKHVSQGGQVSEILCGEPLFPADDETHGQAGEATGNVDGMLNKDADFYDTECDATVAALTSLIEPLLIVVLGVNRRRHRHGHVPANLQLASVAGGL